MHSKFHGRFRNLLILTTFCLIYPVTVGAIVITELMYNPETRGEAGEFIELYNETATRQDLSAWKFASGVSFEFPEGIVISPRSFFVVAKNVEAIRQKVPESVSVFGPFQGALDNNGERLTLQDNTGALIIDFRYGTRGGWPVAPDGTGHSLVKISARLNPSDPANWIPSSERGGSPGKADEAIPESQAIRINEIFIKSARQFVEFYNPSEKPIDLSGYWIGTEASQLAGFKIPEGSMVAPLNVMAVSLGGSSAFKKPAPNDRLFLTTPDAKRVVDACDFQSELKPEDFSRGRWPDGSTEWYSMEPSPNQRNQTKIHDDLVINEIMYHPPSGLETEEYLELYNRGAESIDLTGWSLRGGIQFRFPSSTTLRSHEFLVVAKDFQHLRELYDLPAGVVVGNFSGRLSDDNARIELRDSIGNRVDWVHYYDGGHWPSWADGEGSSLELADTFQDNSNYAAWLPSDESQKSEWTYIRYSGVFEGDGGRNLTRIPFHIHLLGRGEMLIDDVRLTRSSSGFLDRLSRKDVDLIKNGSFERGSDGWYLLGNHVQSITTGYNPPNGRKCMKIRATGSGAPEPNHLEISIEPPLKANEEYTVSFWGKWLWGNNQLVTRCLNNQIPRTHGVPLPRRLGTPGRTNSVFKENLGPVFNGVRHQPVIPTASDPVQIVVAVSDPDGIDRVELLYRPDDDHQNGSAIMHDDGVNGDRFPGDGIYTGLIPALPANQSIAFHIRAVDKSGAEGTWPRNLRFPALYRIESAEARQKRAALTEEMPLYRIIMAKEQATELSSRISLSNEPLNATFVFNERDVYYGVECRYTGSAFRRGRRIYSGYKIRFNADEKLHGVKDHARFDRNDNSTGGHYYERLANFLIQKTGAPYNPEESIRVQFNGELSEMIWEDILAPGKRFLKMFFPHDQDGELFEANDDVVFLGDPGDTSNFMRAENSDVIGWLGTDEKDLYRWHFRVRNQEREDDYTGLIGLLKTLSETPPESFEQKARELIDVEEWLRVIAVRAIVCDWDFLGTSASKNGFFYFSDHTRKWNLLTWDNEWGWQGPGASIYASNPSIKKLQKVPNFEHLYLGIIKELVDKYFNVPYLKPWVQHYHSIVKGREPDNLLKFVEDRVKYLEKVIPSAKIELRTQERTQDGKSVKLTGVAPVNTRGVRIKGKIYSPNWPNPTAWELLLENPETPDLVLEFLNHEKKPIGHLPVTLPSAR